MPEDHKNVSEITSFSVILCFSGAETFRSVIIFTHLETSMVEVQGIVVFSIILFRIWLVVTREASMIEVQGIVVFSIVLIRIWLVVTRETSVVEV